METGLEVVWKRGVLNTYIKEQAMTLMFESLETFGEMLKKVFIYRLLAWKDGNDKLTYNSCFSYFKMPESAIYTIFLPVLVLDIKRKWPENQNNLSTLRRLLNKELLW